MRRLIPAARAVLFLALLCVLLTAASRVLRMKESEEKLKPFLDTAKEADVLFLGDSQVYYGISPLEIYRDYGITSYNLGWPNCMLPMTYWTLMNALDYAEPKAVVIGVMDVGYPNKLSDSFGEVHTAFDAYPMSATKLRAIMDLTDTEETDQYGKTAEELRGEMIFPLIQYHSRWSGLSQEDFEPHYNAQKGASLRIHVTDPDVSHLGAYEGDRTPETGPGYDYLRRAIEECQRRGIAVTLMLAPHPAFDNTKKSACTVETVAREYGVEFLNFVEMDRVVDYYTDCFDPASHLNPSGVQKVSDFLGRYLRDLCDLSDRRGETAYAGWQQAYDAYIEAKLKTMAEQEDGLRSALMLLHDRDFNVVLTMRPGFDTSQFHIKELLQNIAREHVHWNDGKVSAQLNPLEGLQYADGEGAGYFLAVDRDEDEIHELYGCREEEFETSFGTVFCRMDGEWIDLSLTQDGTETYYFDTWEEQDEDAHILVIDRRTGKVALSMALSLEE